jgi:ribosomal protein S6E (S10)
MFTKKSLSMIILSGGLVLAGCSATGSVSEDEEQGTTTQEETSQVENVSNGEEQAPGEELSKGEELSNILTSTNWQGTEVYDEEGNDLTEENSNFIGLAKYDQETNRYEFFDKATGETRGDEGIFFITNDGENRILISQSMGYQAVVDITEISNEIFTYKRMGVDKDGNEVEVYVEHVPYNESELEFTNAGPELTSETGEIVKDIPGVRILADTLWNGTIVLDKDGNDVTEYNNNFISIAKFDAETSKYEFFDVTSGESRGDFGYFDVINDNKIRTHVSIGENKYGAALEITELNDERFTYKRMGKDADGNDIEIYVEHEPYEGEFDPSFGF